MGGKLWASRAGREGRHDAFRGAPETEEWSQPAWEKPLAGQAALLCAADRLRVLSDPLEIPGGSRCGEAGAGVRAGAASSALYLQFRWDPLQRKRLDKEAPKRRSASPQQDRAPCVSPAPQAHRSAAVPPPRGGAAKRCVCQCTPTTRPYQGPEKGSVVPFLPEHLPRERQRVFLPAAAHAHN